MFGLTIVEGAALVGAAASAYSASQSGKGKSGGSTSGPANAADPFSNERPQYQQMLSDMMNPQAATAMVPAGPDNGQPKYFEQDSASGQRDFTPNPAYREGTPAVAANPGSGGFTPQDPSYQWRMSQGMETVNRGAAASGMLQSGNRLAALNDYGQNQASTEYANQFARLSQLAGANIGSPAAAGQIQQQQNAAASAGTQQLIGAAGKGLQSWYNNSQTPVDTGTGFGQSGMADQVPVSVGVE